MQVSTDLIQARLDFRLCIMCTDVHMLCGGFTSLSWRSWPLFLIMCLAAEGSVLLAKYL